MTKAKIINLKTLQAKKYDEIDLGEYYNNLFGQIESRTSIFAYGTSGSGKSVFTLLFSAVYGENIGKALYCSHEEALKKSLRDRTVNFNIESTKVFFGVNIDFQTLVVKIQKNHYRLVIIDSVQYMGFTYEQMQELNRMFSKRKIIFFYVSFGQTYKKPDCNKAIMHACDIKLFFDKGRLTIDSRYKSETLQVQLFKPELKRQGYAMQPQLF
jgi:energy-coupling factor transporter ATP-binding protein EcfA2